MGGTVHDFDLWHRVGEPALSSIIGVMREGALDAGRRMATQRAHYEPFAWWLTRERIGQDLRERYPALEELPPRLLTLFRNLDSVEGNQLLRACRKRLESRIRHD
jgi:hypothetical protein